MNAQNNQLFDSVDARSKLAGSNKMEILLFSLGTGEIFGINVFKVREVCQTPAVTKTPNMPVGVEGVISLRGNIIPVIALAKFIDLAGAPEDTGHTMIVTEYSRHTQGFLVHDVDRIIRVDWDRVKPPQAMLAGNEGLITAITELPDGKLVSILDVEQILANAIGIEPVPELAPVETEKEQSVFFVDDSSVARKEIVMVLDKLGVKYQQATNGLEAWEKLQNLAARAHQDGNPLHDQIRLILVDAEMPEMDGYVLAKNLKGDRRFEGIPVVMHSSLSSEANRAMGQSVGVDAYVAKFDPTVLAETLRPLLLR
jgi:two-component system chemotaxis response regulator CheV